MVMVPTGQDITRIREGMGLTLAEFGEKVGVSEATVSRWESGKRNPTYTHLVRINELVSGKKARRNGVHA